MIISLSGKQGSGKSTIAALLAKTLHATPLHLASTLRDELEALGMPRALMDTQEGKASTVTWEGRSLTVREVMCEHGARRYAENPLWLIEGLLAKATDGLYIVDDVRRKNEAAHLAFFGPVIRIEHYAETESQEITEYDLDDWPYFDFTFYPAYGELAQVTFHILRALTQLPGVSAEGIYALSAKLIHA